MIAVAIAAAGLVGGLSAACRGDPGAARSADRAAHLGSNEISPGDPSPTQPSDRSPPSPTSERAAPGPRCPQVGVVSSRYPRAERVVAIGDVHGDLAATRRALALAGAIDENDRWVGGALVVVQTGDVLDRGDDEQAILDLFDTLARQAEAAGGAVHLLLGNHETINARGDFRYVTPGGFADFTDVPDLDLDAPGLAPLPAAARARAAALSPGGVYARRLAHSNAVIVVGDTVFAHGGVLPAWAAYGIDRFNAELRCWLAGATAIPASLAAPDNPLWSRDYAGPEVDCRQLERALDALGAKRMVVGHTIQPDGITQACNGRVVRIDTGMARHYGGPTEVLELRAGPDQVSSTRVLRRQAQ
ncbi:metallophosphoesterase [Haliangium sp.]|uniref:metallophosphoesterase n=1 Tax=Haliangium sp. TaxID=2663208 RepID=UPI003D11CF8C